MQSKSLPARLTATEADALNGTYLTDALYDELIGPGGEVVCVNKEGSGLLLAYVPGAVLGVLSDDLVAALRRAASETHNRGSAADGTVLSGIAGYYDPYPRWPYCRITRFTRDDAAGWQQLLRLVYRMSAVYREVLPRRYEEQRAWVEPTSRDFRIEGTPFTTMTVNRNQRFKAHRDRGNLRLGTVVMSVPRAVGYSGCRFVMPGHAVGVDLREGDLVLFDGNEYHGNTELVPTAPDPERITVVGYYRSAMIGCGTAEEEHEKAKCRRPGDPLR